MGPKPKDKEKDQIGDRSKSGKRKIVGKDKKGKPIYEEIPVEEEKPIIVEDKSMNI